MILLNFARKLDPISLELFKQMTGTKIDEQITLPIEASTIDEFISGFEKAALKLKLTDSELCADRIAINPSGNQIQMQVSSGVFIQKDRKVANDHRNQSSCLWFICQAGDSGSSRFAKVD